MRLPKAQKLKEELEVSHWMEITSGGLELYTSSPSWLSLSSSTLPFLAPSPVERMNWILSLGFSSMHEMDFIWSGTRNEDNIRIFTTITDTKGLVDMSKKMSRNPSHLNGCDTHMQRSVSFYTFLLFRKIIKHASCIFFTTFSHFSLQG